MDGSFSATVGGWWTWFRIVVFAVAMGGALYAWAKPALTGKLDVPDEYGSSKAKPENVGKMKRMLACVGIAVSVWWLTSDGGIALLGEVFNVAGEVGNIDEDAAVDSPLSEEDARVSDDWFTPATTETTT